jgi:hypothetical protein
VFDLKLLPEAVLPRLGLLNTPYTLHRLRLRAFSHSPSLEAFVVLSLY